MTLTILGISVFTGIILILVLILNFAESKLLPKGDVIIKINGDDDKVITTRPGGTLLSTLANENIFLPSACGGGGTCALCRCQVLDGGGEILPTETGFINRKDAKDNWRLGCQVKIKENMDIYVPDEVFNIRKWDCKVRSNKMLPLLSKN
jgi:Na+-transporting NADH:ubiquinone oxidoreductase subunit F